MQNYEEVADAVGTPFYAYDGDLFRERIRRFLAAFAGIDHVACYALKANDALALVRIAAEEGLGADIVSGGELTKALRAGVPGARIVFSGVGKRRDEIRAALLAGVRALNVESLGELDVVAEEAAALGVVAPVSARLNPDVEAETHAYVATGSAGSKFGLGAGDAREAYRRAAADPTLEPVGISFHVGSQLGDPAPVLAAAERAAGLWRELEADGVPLRDLDAGGGLGIAYDGGEEAAVEPYAEALAGVARELGATLVLEPGRWLVGPVGTLVTRVLYVKDAPGRRIAVCDGGMNDLIRPALYDARHPIRLADGADGRPSGAVDVVGPVCETGDFFALDVELPLPEPGDLLELGQAGAYCRVMSSTYNARPLCAEVLWENGAYRVVRAPVPAEELALGELP
ncbi:MAG TPA: diaminopimelate decarboxylase [Gaiellaceae bacterium]|nr:diaminopimelate decarboxylase [Gaiellaceae bacterium]